MWHSTDIYKKEIYQCNRKFNSTPPCDSQNLTTERIQALFIEEFNKFIAKKSSVINNVKKVIDKLPDEKEILKELNSKRKEIEKLGNEINEEIYDETYKVNTSNIKGKSGLYQRNRVDESIDEYETLKVRVAELELKYNKTIERKNGANLYIKELKDGKAIKEFNVEYWNVFLDKMIVFKDKIEVKFKI